MVFADLADYFVDFVEAVFYVVGEPVLPDFVVVDFVAVIED
jgi:hypothetical protein